MNTRKKTIILIGAGLSMLLTGGAAMAALVNPGFEIDEPTYDTTAPYELYPSSFGDWQGDESHIVVAEGGITPFGDRMLRFESTIVGPGGGTAGQLWQFVDMAPYSALIQSDQGVATFSFHVNRVPGDAQTDTSFGVRLSSHTGTIGQFPSNEIDYVTAGILSDGNTATWELVSTQPLTLDKTTTYLAVQIVANENVHDDNPPYEFDGHYADNCTLDIVPEPTTLGLLALGALAGIRRRRTLPGPPRTSRSSALGQETSKGKVEHEM